MNTRHQLIIDQLIAKPIAFCMNFLVRLAGKILSIDHSLDVPFKRIVVCKFKGLGSIIQATPMLQTLRTAYPDAEIIFLSTRSNAPFLAEIDVIDQVITVDDTSAWRLIKTLSTAIIRLILKRPGVYIDLEIYSNFSSLITIASLARNRIGFYLRSSSFKMGIYTHMMSYNTNVPISEVYMQIARLMSRHAPSPGLFKIHKNIGENDGLGYSNYIIINPNASDLRIERRWEGVKFRDLTAWLCTVYPEKTMIFIGSPQEQQYVNKVLLGLTYPNLVNLAGKTSVKELIRLIQGAELMITNDTGPMHIAFACDTPTIALFGPCSPQQYGKSSNTKIIYKRIYCSPCVHEFITPPCKGNNSCMQLISMQEVADEIQEFYSNGKKFSNAPSSTEEIHYLNKDEVLGIVSR